MQWSEKRSVFGRHVEPVKTRKSPVFWASRFLHRTFFSDRFVLFSEIDESEINPICFIFWWRNVTFLDLLMGFSMATWSWSWSWNSISWFGFSFHNRIFQKIKRNPILFLDVSGVCLSRSIKYVTIDQCSVVSLVNLGSYTNKNVLVSVVVDMD